MKKQFFTGILLSILGLASCGEPELARPVSRKAYFDVPGFVQGQLAFLNGQKPGLRKTVWVNGEKPETQQLKTVNWGDELRHFQEIDLNKKALAGSYSVSELITTDGKKTIYSRNPDVTAPIKTLEIITGPENRVKHLRAISEEKNGLFYSREERVLQTGNDNRIHSYRISGVQKVLLFDSLHYAAEAEITSEK